MNTPSDDCGSSGPEIVCIKFSLPEVMASRIQMWANKHYSGNRSEFLRSASEDHARTLERGGRTLPQEILDEIKSVRETVDELRESLKTSDAASGQSSTVEVVGAATEDTVEEEVNGHDPIEGDMWPVYQEIADAYPNSLCVDEIVSSGNISETDVRHALIDLRARGKIVSSTVEGTTHHQIAVDESE